MGAFQSTWEGCAYALEFRARLFLDSIHTEAKERDHESSHASPSHQLHRVRID